MSQTSPPSPCATRRNHLFDELQVGASVSLERILTAEEARLFAALCGEPAPAAVGAAGPGLAQDEGDDAAHSAWASALLLALLGARLPGAGTRVRQLELRYLQPLRVGESLTLRATVRALDPDGRSVTLACLATDAQGTPVIEGQAVVEAPARRIERCSATLPDIGLRTGGGVQRLLDHVRTLPAVRAAIVHPCDALSLSAVFDARAAGLIDPVLVAPRARLEAVAEAAGLDLNGLAIEDVPHSHAAAARAAELAQQGVAEILVKGSLHTDELMAAVVASAAGLRTKRRISHCFVMQTPAYPRPFIITDAAVNITPDLDIKADIVRNAIELAHAIGVAQPRVAILAAVETVNPHMPATLDAAALCKMADRGQITGALLDGPLAFDNAVSAAAARIKGIDSPVAGQADILVVPDLESGNMLAKQLEYMGQAESAGIVLGAKVPVVLTSRADSRAARLASCAIALILAHRYRLAPP